MNHFVYFARLTIELRKGTLFKSSNRQIFQEAVFYYQAIVELRNRFVLKQLDNNNSDEG